jgi:hypothetical protein
MSYFYLGMAVFSLGMLGVMHKVADHRSCRPEAINLFLFLWAGAILSAYCLLRDVGFLEVRDKVVALLGTPGKAILVAAICGMFAGIAILNFQHGIRFGRISTSWLVINLSTIVPTTLSILIYPEVEEVTPKRALSLLLALVSLCLLWLDRRREEQQTKTPTPQN